MYCTRCGARNDDTNRFCVRCGTGLPAAVAPAPVPPPTPVRPRTAPAPTITAGYSATAPRLPGPLSSIGATGYGDPGRRFVAAVVDGTVGWVLSSAALNLLGWESAFNVLMVTTGVLWLYFAGSEASGWQATPGKRLVELRVVDVVGQGLSFGEASRRFFAKALALLLFGVGLAMILFDDEHQGMHAATLASWGVRD